MLCWVRFLLQKLGAMLPRSGGQFVVAHRALVTYAGFVVGRSDWISTCGTSAAITIVVAEYAIVLVPSLQAFPTGLIASTTLIGFGLLQLRGVRWGSRIQETPLGHRPTLLLVRTISGQGLRSDLRLKIHFWLS